MKVTVDRIENDIAVMLIRPDEKNSIEVPIKYISVAIKEGDILNLNFETIVLILIIHWNPIRSIRT